MPGKKAKSGGANARGNVPQGKAPQGPAAEQEVSERVWLVGRILVLAIAAFLRLYNLALVPLHHDEGVNGNFLMRLFREGYYHYDPANYHGPTLYYFALLTTYIFGPTTFAIRLLPALFGIATVWLVLCLRWRLGTVAALAGAALLAVSPGAVYMSRYFIHESLFVFFTLAIVYAALKYWDEANPLYLIFVAISAALLFATKETAIISLGVLVIALGSTLMYALLRDVAAGAPFAEKSLRGANAAARSVGGGREEPAGLLGRLGGPTSVLTFLGIAVAVFIALNVIFYSSFFSNWKGVRDALETFNFWTKTGKKEHVHEFSAYLKWLWQEESPLLVLGAAGIILAVWRGSNRLAIFIALWAFGILTAYSLVPYKTPWLMLNFIVPLAIIGGYAVEAIYKAGKNWQLYGQVLALAFIAVALGLMLSVAAIGAYRTDAVGELRQLIEQGASLTLILLIEQGAALTLILSGVGLSLYQIYEEGERRQIFGKVLAVTLLVAALSVCGYQTVSLNFFNYDDDRFPYVYAHTRRETLKLVDEINRLAKRAGTNDQTGITITSPDYWPLPWYLRDYKRVGYFGQMTTASEPLIICREDQSAQVQAMLGDRYKKVGSYALRPGVILVLFARGDLSP
jgi:uncharacterized protein (TIGR03663 family)